MADTDQSLKVTNIGDSPAFDVEVSTLEVGGTRLSTAKIAYLVQAAPAESTHKLEPARGVTGILGPAAMFLQDAKAFFDNQSRRESIQSNYRYTVPFTVAYRALDGRQFNQPYVFVVDFMQLKGWTEATGSLLENVPPAPKQA